MSAQSLGRGIAVEPDVLSLDMNTIVSSRMQRGLPAPRPHRPSASTEARSRCHPLMSQPVQASARVARTSSLGSMVELVAVLATAPWMQPLRFRPLSGWHAGANGTFNSSYGPPPDIASPKESTAWMTRGVRYRDRRTADPPDRSISHLSRHAILVFAVAYESGRADSRIKLRLDRATRYACCDGTYVAGGEYALAGTGPEAAYSVIVRVYFGSPPGRSMRAQAQRALDHLVLPRPK